MDNKTVAPESSLEDTRIEELVHQQQRQFDQQRLRERQNLIATITAAIALATLFFTFLIRIENRIDNNSTRANQMVAGLRTEIQEDRRALDDDIDRLGDILTDNIIQLTGAIGGVAAHTHGHANIPAPPPATDPPTP